jgi:hypothetical protein
MKSEHHYLHPDFLRDEIEEMKRLMFEIFKAMMWSDTKDKVDEQRAKESYENEQK